MRYIKDILNKWWNVLGTQGAYFPYTFPAINGNNKIVFQGSPCTIRVATKTVTQKNYIRIRTSNGVPELISIVKRPFVLLSIEVSRMAGKVQYLEINGTVIFDDR